MLRLDNSKETQPMAISYYDRKGQYARLWASMEIRPSKAPAIDATARRILAQKARYGAISDHTGVPWFVIGIIHAMEAGLNFNCHLHNGDSLAHRTVQVPRGRPRAGSPPFQWQDSAIDAIRCDGLDKWKMWSIEGIAYCFEKFNGWGYAQYHPEVNSPYLWSGCNHYSSGKYVADGKWSASAVSGQSGAMPILKRIMELDGSVVPTLSTDAPAPVEEVVADPALAFPRAIPDGSAGAIGGAVAHEEIPGLAAGDVAATTAPAVAVDAKPGFWERFNFNLVNEFAEQGSRLAGSLRTVKNVLHGLIWGPPAATGSAMQLNSAAGNAQVAAAHPNLMLALLCVALGISIAAGIVYLIIKFVLEPRFVSAAKDKRYVPRGGTLKPAGVT